MAVLPRAKIADIYCKQLGLSAHEHELITSLSGEGRYFLMHYAQGLQAEILRLDLHGLDKVLALISARAQSVALLDTLLKDKGYPQDSSLWLDEFFSSCQQQGLLCAPV